MTIPASEIVHHLPKVRQEFRVRHANGATAFTITTRQLIVLAAKGYVEGELYADEVIYARLLVDERVALRLISPLMVRSTHGVTRKVQGRGAKQWVVRPERAAARPRGFVSTLLFPQVSSCLV